MLYARVSGDFRVGEALEIGAERRPGEVIRLKDDELVGQVYEDTTGLRPGDAVHGTGSALSVQLGPGLLGRIFDGLLRPLDTAEYKAPEKFGFRPLVKAGDSVAAGQPFGELPGDGINQQCLLPPDIGGAVERIEAEGAYAHDAKLCTIKTVDGATREIGFFHRWPVRQTRPVRERLPADEPMITGQRILDTLFPVARGGQAAIPGGFGTGKTVLQETLAKWCDADVIVYVGCGERGNEMAEVLREFPSLTDPRTGRGLMERTVIIANTSNMPVAAREASIYTAVTVGEYFREQGLHVALMADSTSRWAEALARSLGPAGRTAGRGRLSGLSRLAAGRILRARGAGEDARRRGRLAHHHRRGLAARRRFLRAGDQPHQALCALLLGPRPRAGAGALLSRHSSVAVLFRERACVLRLGGLSAAIPSGMPIANACCPCWRRKRISSVWRASSARTRCHRPSS